MVDYLEESLERAEALLEQVRRLERRLSGRRPVKDGERLEERSPSGEEKDREPAAEKGKSGGAVAEPGQAGPGPLLEDLEAPGHQLLYEKRMLETPDQSSGQLEKQDVRKRNEVLDDPEVPEGSGVPEPSSSGGHSGAPALLEQMERLERAEAVSTGELALQRRAGSGALLGWERGQGSYPVSLPGPGAAAFPAAPGQTGHGWAGEAGLEITGSPFAGAGREHPGALSPGAVRWAEQADKIFSRDSRRYDGGFYLF